MENFKAIEFHRTRDFSNKLNATFEFVKQNFKPLGKSLLVIAGPPILVVSLFMSSFMADMMNMQNLVSQNDPTAIFDYYKSSEFWIQMAVMMVGFTVAGVVTVATCNNYLLLYGEKKSNQIEVSEVWERVRDTFWMYCGTMFFYVVFLVIGYALAAVPAIILGYISMWLIVFGVIFFFVAVVYISVAASFVFIIRSYENVGFAESVRRSFYLIRDKWWSTFGLVMVLSMVANTVSSVFFVPWYVISLTTTMHTIQTGEFQEPSTMMQVMSLVFLSLYNLCNLILYVIPNVGIAFQYFNLVERKEARGLMTSIDSIGKPATPNAGDEQY